MFDDSNVFDEWIKISFDKYREGNKVLNRHQMKLAVISLTGRKTKLPSDKKEFSFPDLYTTVGNITRSQILSDIPKVYDEIDQDSKGYLQVDDLLKAANMNGASIQQDALINAFQRADTDHDGMLSYKMFIDIVKNGLIELGFSE